MSSEEGHEEGICTTGSEKVVKLHVLSLIPTKSLHNSMILVMSTIGRRLIMFPMHISSSSKQHCRQCYTGFFLLAEDLIAWGDGGKENIKD